MDVYQECLSLVPGVFEGLGGQLMVRGAPQTVIDGEMRPRTNLVQFPDLATAKA